VKDAAIPHKDQQIPLLWAFPSQTRKASSFPNWLGSPKLRQKPPIQQYVAMIAWKVLWFLCYY